MDREINSTSTRRMRVFLLCVVFGTANALTARRLSSSLIRHALCLEEFCYVVYMLKRFDTVNVRLHCRIPGPQNI